VRQTAGQLLYATAQSAEHRALHGQVPLIRTIPYRRERTKPPILFVNLFNSAQRDDQMALSERAQSTTSRLVLIADRDPDTRSLFADYLRRAGWETEQAEDGRDALAKAIGRHPAVVVTETRLAFINGYELCRLLRGDTDTATTPIIVVTGDGYPGHSSHAQQAGAQVVLSKPCLPERLESEIRKVVGVGATAQGRTVDGRDLPADSRSTAAPRRSLVRSHYRHETNAPPLTPPELLCPTCDRPLSYIRSHIGGVSEHHPEQWDYFLCPSSCGTFQYRHRTRRLRLV
jgi:CheY-like chemotaxis protein